VIDRDVGARNFLAEERAAAHRPSQSCRTRRRSSVVAGWISISSICTMVRFSGRVTGLNANSGVVCLLRPSRVRSAIPLEHRVGIRVVLQHDGYAIAVADQCTQFPDFLLGKRLIHSSETFPRRIATTSKVNCLIAEARGQARGPRMERITGPAVRKCWRGCGSCEPS